MTEQEWLTSADPQNMLRFVTRDGSLPGDGPNRKIIATDRKLRLFACVCLKVGGCGIYTEKSILDANATLFLHDLLPHAVDCCREDQRLDIDARKAALLRCLFGNPWRPVLCRWCAGDGLASHEDDEAKCPVCGGSGGMPLRWLTPTVHQLAQSIYDDRRWEDTGILADTLEEAGMLAEVACPKCHGSGTYTVQATNPGLSAANGYSTLTTYSEWRGCRHCGGDYDKKGVGMIPDPLLAHLRGPGPHARGCWAIDCILRKE